MNTFPALTSYFNITDGILFSYQTIITRNLYSYELFFQEHLFIHKQEYIGKSKVLKINR